MKNIDEKELKHAINRYLKKLGIRIDIVGFKYLAVMLKEKNNKNFSCSFYSDIAEICKTTASRVEKAIRYITQIHQEELKEHFQVNYKITNKVLFELVKNELQEELESLVWNRSFCRKWDVKT